MSTEERYARATRSSHLEVEAEHRGDVDTIIAAGMVKPKERLGALLTRLRGEWDAIHPRERAQAADDLTARVLILIKLRTLREAKSALRSFAHNQSRHRRGLEQLELEPADRRIDELCGKVLDVWLDRKCHHCEGRGFNGGYREPQVHCRPCRGTGNRRLGTLHEVDALHQYGLWILNVMDTKSTGAMGQINRKTRSNA